VDKTMPQINVLHLINAFEESSIGTIILRLVTYLGQENYGWHVGALCNSGDMQAKFIHSGAETMDFSKSGKYQLNIRDYVLTHQIRIIHTHTPHTILKVASSHPPGIIHLSTRHLLASSTDRRWGFPYALWDRSSLYLPDHIVAVSKTMYSKIVSQPGMDESRVTMIRNGIPVEQFNQPEQRAPYRTTLGLPPETFVIGYAGRIQKVKRIDLLLLAFSIVFSRFPQARLIIAGEGDLKNEMQEYAFKLGISDAVLWLGLCSEIPRFLAAVDIYIQSSSNEGLSLSILEAMAAGKPIVATDVGGGNESIINEITGILVKPGNPHAIANAVIDLLEHPDKQTRFGQAARSQVIDNFNIQSMVDSYGLIYQRIIK
jgi:glycosyltransferase involved in cell wall biosynthesis